MFRIRKYKSRRAEIRRNRPDVAVVWQSLKSPTVLSSVGIAVLFWLLAVAIGSLRDGVVRVRPGDFVHEDVRSRVAFESVNPEYAQVLRQQARDRAASIYRTDPEGFDRLRSRLLSLPEDVSVRAIEQLPTELKLDSGAITSLKKIYTDRAELDAYRKWVDAFVARLKDARDLGLLVVLPHEQREKDLKSPERKLAKLRGERDLSIDLSRTFSRRPGSPPPAEQREEMLKVVDAYANQNFLAPLSSNIAAFTVDTILPTHEFDAIATDQERADAAARANVSAAQTKYVEDSVMIAKDRVVTPAQWKMLNEEQRAFVAQVRADRPQDHWLSLAGLAGILFVLTGAIAAYAGFFQPRIVKNRARGLAIVGLMLSMLLVAQLAALGTYPILVFGVAPTLLVAMILAIAYDQRFALGVATLHALMVTICVGQGVDFFLVTWSGILAGCFMLDEVRSRAKLVEVGGVVAVMMMLACGATGALRMDPLAVIGRNCLHAGATGLGVGFVVLGILYFIERAFKITTSMTLLELADASHPLLRRLQLEAPGTYNHSLQVATLAEAAAEAVGADSLLCRVGSYYHDVGKINKPSYFCENQFGGPNRHINLTPNVSLLIIVGHVKDGVELAREYKLPPAIQSIVQQHHGTTLVEYFYHQAKRQAACDTNTPDSPQVISDSQFRYPGPKPRSRESAIVMICDCVESATRAMVEPSAPRIEGLVHDLVMKRLLDGQFDECDLTLGELHQVETSVVRTLLGIYHGRMQYPSTAALTEAPSSANAATARSAG